MLQDIVKRGKTSWRGARLFCFSSTTFLPKTDVTYNSSGIDLWYQREGSTRTAITEATLAATASAYSSGGFIHVSDGIYRLDLPNAALESASGVNFVDYGGAVTGGVFVGGRIRLVDFDLDDAVRAGLTALPNANAEAAGGLYPRGTGAGQIAQNANGQVDARVLSLDTQAKADVNAEVLDVLNTDTFAEPGQGDPPATATLAQKIGYLYKTWRNRKTQTSIEWTLYNDDATTKGQKATVSDDGATTTKGEISTGA